MALRKSEVEKYISKIEGRLNSPHEVQHNDINLYMYGGAK
jgi:hypothetical protein